jgi:histidinol-phosphatase (PHP family)
MTKINYHTHHYLCRHASGNVDDYVLEAIKNGYKILGMSDHGPLPCEPPFERMSYKEFEEIYLKQIEDAKTKYQNKLQILKGLEIEYIYNYDSFYKDLLTKVDYLILACHYYSGDELTMKYKGSGNVNDSSKLEEYTDLAVAALNTGYFKIFAHPDIFMTSYPYFDSHAKECSKRIIEAAIKNNVVLEFNANGLRKGKRKFENGDEDYSYPCKNFWNLVSEMNAEVTIGSDCHEPKLLHDYYVELSIELVKNYKLNIVKTIF